MDFSGTLAQLGKTAAVLIPLLIITLGLAALFDGYFARERLRGLFAARDFAGSLLASVVSTILPHSAGGVIPLAAYFRATGGQLLPILSFVIAGAALSLPSIALTFWLGWRMVLLRIGGAMIMGLLVGIVAARRLEAGQSLTTLVDWRSLCRDAYCDIRPELEGWESTYPVRAFLQLLLNNLRIYLPWLLLSLAIVAIASFGGFSEVLGQLLTKWWSPLVASAAGLPAFFIGGSDVPVTKLLIDGGASTATVVSFMLGAPVVNLPVYLLMSRWLGRSGALQVVVIGWLSAATIGWLVMLFEWLMKLFR